MFETDKEVEKITITYTDGSEKAVTRGCCFSEYDERDDVKVACDGIGSAEDCIAVLAIVSKIAKEEGITDEILEKVECVGAGGEHEEMHL